MNSKGLFPKIQAVHTTTFILKQKQRALKHHKRHLVANLDV